MTQGESALLMKIREMEPTLSAMEGKAAGYVLEHPREVIYLSITGLAEACGVSDATIVRLCKRLGMQGYQELKVTLAQDIVSPIQSIHEDISESDSPDQILSKVFQSTVHSLEYTQRILDVRQFERAVEALDRAGKVFIYGSGNSGSVAMDLQHKLLRVGINATAYTDGHMQSIASTLLGPGDVCACISHSGSSRDVIEAAQLAKERGALVLCMTNIGRNPLADLSDLRLDTASKETEYHIVALASRVAQYVIINCLYTELALARKETQRESAMTIERALERKKF